MTKLNLLIEDEKFNRHYNNSSTSCKTEIDSVTKRKLYTDADFPATIEGGQMALIKALQRGVNTDLTEEDSGFWGGKIVVAFIVETNGEITGERVVEDKTNRVGKEMLK